MISLLVSIGLLISIQTPTEKEAGFEAILRAVGTENPGMELYLSNLPLDRLSNPPPVAAGDSLTSDPDWVARMEQEGVIAFSCVPSPGELGCTTPGSSAKRNSVGVFFRSAEYASPDRMTVGVTLGFPPLRSGAANMEGREYSLARTPEGRWHVVSYKVTGVT